MHVVGLTGSIASGKSTVSALLKELGATIIDADVIAREVVKPGTAGSRMLREAFGDVVFHDDGSLDRRALGNLVFGDDTARLRLNAILHPLVIAECNRKAKETGEANPDAVAVIDAALLIEAGMYRSVDVVVLVTADDATRLKRIMQRDGLKEEQAKLRMDAQMPQEEKKRYADALIDNSSGLEYTRKQVVALYEALAKGERFHKAGM